MPWLLFEQTLRTVSREVLFQLISLTRMHSSRLHTVRCNGWRRGMSAGRRVWPGGCLPRGVYPSMQWGRPSPVNRMTDRCKTLPCRYYVADGNVSIQWYFSQIWERLIQTGKGVIRLVGKFLLKSTRKGHFCNRTGVPVPSRFATRIW